ncbi:DUF6090 family protein [Zeaxanthinibacter enoshimensis]|uniref:Uncharacterized protein n=1 Tax=Zeaxanthinibacter enoshimensis TaxID=392009 RepID=A0A4R6TQ17_9FLAO|nr:DUF6090 family protein [Zeaxanthinibacter enoshimensis]TDQ32193.1 hypothetical protein CLV82_0016 [Zeaxanthinibacter enoshimensis]
MIKFFRRIRQHLLAENKFSKYLLYAIGEIALVVIGILIALQINTWNDEIKATKVEVKFFANILLDLEKDDENLNFYLHFHTKRIEYLDTLLTYVRNPHKKMGIDKFGQYVEPIFYSINTTSYSTTFESAKSMGTFNNFKEMELLKGLSRYYADFILLENLFSSITRFVENQFEPLMYSLPEGYMTASTGDLVINEEDTQEFYDKIASIKDNREIEYDYERILRTPLLENYIIGDLGRTYNSIGKIKSRQEMLRLLKRNIEQRK